MVFSIAVEKAAATLSEKKKTLERIEIDINALANAYNTSQMLQNRTAIKRKLIKLNHQSMAPFKAKTDWAPLTLTDQLKKEMEKVQTSDAQVDLDSALTNFGKSLKRENV
jgi:hypothetical protein